ncbi:hypothetical protein ACWEKM_24620 [Streptomyces sp. NPDC004752]
MPSPVTTRLNRPTDTDGSSAPATPQNTDVTAVNVVSSPLQADHCADRLAYGGRSATSTVVAELT